jgi:hypothetical protein
MEDCRQIDASVARDCFKSGSQDHHERINLSIALSGILDAHLLQIIMGWLPAAKGSPVSPYNASKPSQWKPLEELQPSHHLHHQTPCYATQHAKRPLQDGANAVWKCHATTLHISPSQAHQTAALPPLINGISKFPVANGDHKHQTPYRTCIHRRVHFPFPPCSLDTRTPPNGAPGHRNMPTPRRFQERLPPASLKHAIDLSHFWHEGKGLCAGHFLAVSSLLKT